MSEEIINLLCEKLGLAVEWAGENIVPQAEELMTQLAYAQYTLNLIFCIISIIAFVGFFVLVICDIKFDWSDGSIPLRSVLHSSRGFLKLFGRLTCRCG